MNFKNAIWTSGHFRSTICNKIGKNATETYGMLQTAFGASWMNRAPVFEWHKRFKEGRESAYSLNWTASSSAIQGVEYK